MSFRWCSICHMSVPVLTQATSPAKCPQGTKYIKYSDWIQLAQLMQLVIVTLRISRALGTFLYFCTQLKAGVSASLTMQLSGTGAKLCRWVQWARKWTASACELGAELCKQWPSLRQHWAPGKAKRTNGPLGPITPISKSAQQCAHTEAPLLLSCRLRLVMLGWRRHPHRQSSATP